MNNTDNKKELEEFFDNPNKEKNEKVISKSKYPNENFDIVDFLIKHDGTYAARKKSKVPLIIGIVVFVLMLIGVIVLAVIFNQGKEQLDSSTSDNTIIGTWISGNQTMYITEEYISIGGQKSEYILEGEDIIALKVGADEAYEYYKMAYRLIGDKLYLYLSDENGKLQEIEYEKG